MQGNSPKLFITRRFFPFFVTQFLGAFNDNLFKQALVVLITFTVASGGQSGLDPAMLVTIAAGLFILPFFLFSALAGQLADRYEKHQLIRIIKMVEVALMLLAAYGFWHGHSIFLLLVLFLMGTQSAFFGPVKYGVLPELINRDELINGNALIETGTFLAILLGTIAGGLLVLAEQGSVIIAYGLVLVAMMGFASSCAVPRTPNKNPDMPVHLNIFRETKNVMVLAMSKRTIWLAIVGISWFWFIGATFLAQLPSFVKTVLQGDEQVVTFLMCAFSIGIGVGSLLCNLILKGQISTKYMVWALFGMSVFIADFYAVILMNDLGQVSSGNNLQDLTAFLKAGHNIRIFVDFALIAICGGIYIVPLYALLQDQSPPHERARMIAANNIVNSLLMVMSAVLAIAIIAAGFDVADIFAVIAGLNALFYFYIRRLKVT